MIMDMYFVSFYGSGACSDWPTIVIVKNLNFYNVMIYNNKNLDSYIYVYIHFR